MPPYLQRRLKKIGKNPFLRKYKGVDKEGIEWSIPVFDDEMAHAIFKNFDDFDKFHASHRNNESYESMNAMFGIALAQDKVTGKSYVTIGASTNGTEVLEKFCDKNSAALEKQIQKYSPGVIFVNPKSTTDKQLPYYAFQSSRILYDIKGNEVPNTSEKFCAATSTVHNFAQLKNENLVIKKMAERGRFNEARTPVTPWSKGKSGNGKQVPLQDRYHPDFNAPSCAECCTRIPDQYKLKKNTRHK